VSSNGSGRSYRCSVPNANASGVLAINAESAMLRVSRDPNERNEADEAIHDVHKEQMIQPHGDGIQDDRMDDVDAKRVSETTRTHRPNASQPRAIAPGQARKRMARPVTRIGRRGVMNAPVPCA